MDALLQDYNASQALDPEEAATLFRSGSELAFLTDPYVGFVMGRWMNQQVMCLQVPPDLVAYSTENPVIIYGTYVPPAPGVAVAAFITIRTAGWTVRGNNMAVELPNGKVVDLTVTYEDADGNPTSAPGDVTWTSSDPSIATIEADDDDDTKAVVTSVAEGSTSITAQSGGITASIDVDVTAEGGEAVSANITAGEPRDPDAPNQGLPSTRAPARQAPAAPRTAPRPPQAPVAGRTAAPIRRG
jgi:hypothetical protein